MPAADPLPPAVHDRAAAFAPFSPRESELSGAILAARYKVHGFLTKGATSRVYLAEDLTTETPVVIKMLRPDSTAKQELRERLLREAEVARAVDHPNVVRVLDAGESPTGEPYLVLEALVGETLGELLRRTSTLPEREALILMRQAAAGLSAAHRAGIIHRDVKPDNFLLLGPPGEAHGLKLIDFGMAKFGHVSGTSGTHTVLGTLEYMAPEQILVERVDARTDVYSLGVVMFRVFTGHLPFENAATTDLIRHQLFSSLPPPSWLNEKLDSRLEALIVRATRKHPDNRYPSMEAMLEDIEKLLGLQSGEVGLGPLVHTPDAYEPTTERGQEAIDVLAEKFGPHALLRPSRV